MISAYINVQHKNVYSSFFSKIESLKCYLTILNSMCHPSSILKASEAKDIFSSRVS